MKIGIAEFSDLSFTGLRPLSLSLFFAFSSSISTVDKMKLAVLSAREREKKGK